MPNPALTPAILQPLLAGLSRTLPRGEEQDQQTAAALLEAFLPQTPIQAMLAAQAVALHHAAIDCFGRAMQTGPEDHTTATRLQRNAASLTRAFTATLHTLQRCQIAAAQAAEAGQQDPVQREDDAGGTGASVALAKATARGTEERAAPGPRVHEDDDGGPRRSGTVSAENPLQREPAPAQRPWEQLTEAEQFAILYPERAAAGATSHEDVDLWLVNPGRPAAPARPA